MEHLDVIEQALPSLIEGTVFMGSNMLGFQRMEEAFHRRVVVAIALTAHARLDTVF